MNASRSLSIRTVLISMVIMGYAADWSFAQQIDLTNYQNGCRVRCVVVGQELDVQWPLSPEGDYHGYLLLSADPQSAPVRKLGIIAREQDPVVLLADQRPTYFLTVGTRQMPPGKPDWQKWWTFFDNPAQRPHETYRLEWTSRKVRVISDHDRVEIQLGECRAGTFQGQIVVRIFADCDLLVFQAVLSTQEDDRAVLYDAALVGPPTACRSVVWRDVEDSWRREPLTGDTAARPLMVKGRTIVAEGVGGSVAFFPPPHQYFFPRDYTTNLRYVWYGCNYQGLEPQHGIGIRNEKTGGGNWVPWFNAPPGTQQRLSLWVLLSPRNAKDTWDRVLEYTHQDRFPKLPGHVTFTSHYHLAVAVSEMEAQKQGRGGRIPEFVQVFKRMGVNIVHLAEFHGDGHPNDPGPLRLQEQAMMFSECQRLSDEEFLLLPGEEGNRYLGVEQPGKHPGHWMCLFPRPVYWTMVRTPGQPYREIHPQYGKVYHIGSREDMVQLLRDENGLAWVAHPRIKASSWTPDIFRHEDFYLADFFLGAAWKAMPVDLSHDRLGVRALELLDDMANWGQRKYLLGEVDVFKIDHTHELYGHANVNYLQLDAIPKISEGWKSILDVLQSGKFFVTTGEVIIETFSIQGKTGGDELIVSDTGTATCNVVINWTFPPAFIEIISGDGQRVYRQRISCSEYPAFSRTQHQIPIQLAGRRWVRLEAWDVAVNGAFTQPIWIVTDGKAR